MVLQELKTTFRLAIPLMAGQIGHMLLGVADTVMLGRLGATELAASSFAHIIIWVPIVTSLGLMAAVSMRVSQARGAGTPEPAAEALRNGLWLALAAGLAITGGLLALMPWLDRFGQPADVVAAVPAIFLPVALSVLPALLTMPLKNFADAMERPWPVFWIGLGTVVLNVLLNWIMIFGKWGCPAMGLAGAGWATFAARTIGLIALFAWVATTPAFVGWRPRRWSAAPRWALLSRLLALGSPISLGLLTEVAAFNLAGLMAGWLGTTALAAHQIALTCASFTFMAPLGLATATTVKVGACHGAKDAPRLRAVAIGSLWAGAGLMVVSAVTFLLLGPTIASWFIDDPAVRTLAARLLIIAGLFQIFDGLQVTASGVLRGLNDVRVPALLAFVAYWVLALPLAWFAAFRMGWHAEGIWTGLAVGLAVVAAALVARVFRRLPRAGSSALPTHG
jgi:MATE family multidrug resistance protein